MPHRLLCVLGRVSVTSSKFSNYWNPKAIFFANFRFKSVHGICDCNQIWCCPFDFGLGRDAKWLVTSLRAACKSQKWSSRSLADKLTCGHRARPRANHFQKLPFPAWIWPCFTWDRGFGCDAVHPVAPSSGGAFWACDVHVGQRLQTQWPTYGATFTTSPIPTFQMTQAPASKLQPIGLLDRGTPSRLTCIHLWAAQHPPPRMCWPWDCRDRRVKVAIGHCKAGQGGEGGKPDEVYFIYIYINMFWY